MCRDGPLNTGLMPKNEIWAVLIIEMRHGLHSMFAMIVLGKLERLISNVTELYTSLKKCDCSLFANFGMAEVSI